MNKRKSENGQALVLIVLAIVGLFGFAALAVDVGQVYAARRNAQNAADAAALAAGYEAAVAPPDQDHAPAIAKGFALAASNGFDNTDANAFANGTKNNLVEINNPAIGGAYCYICGTPYDIALQYFQVKISIRLNPIFSQLIYKGGQVVTVEAISHIKDAEVISAGNAIHALSHSCANGNNNAMFLDGTTSIKVDGGYMYSNGCWTKDGSSGQVLVVAPNEAGVPAFLDGGIKASGNNNDCNGCKEDTNGVTPSYSNPNSFTDLTVWPPVDDTAKAQDLLEVAPPYCPTADTTIDGVNYYVHNSGLSTADSPLKHGIHCVKGDISGKITTEKAGAMIVLLSGKLVQNGGDSLDITASYTEMKDRNGTDWSGMALFVPKNNASDIVFGGNTPAAITGTIYAPSSTCDMGGSSEGTYYTNMICKQVKFHGTTQVSVTYRQENLWHNKPTVELVQ